MIITTGIRLLECMFDAILVCTLHCIAYVWSTSFVFFFPNFEPLKNTTIYVKLTPTHLPPFIRPSHADGSESRPAIFFFC